MVSIPGGMFLMGSDIKEVESQEDEYPQHLVEIKSFFMSKYLITQQQWNIIANLATVNRELPIEPAYFQGDNLPVERVSWNEAQEFCDRLSQFKNRNYCLPSEAQWEYVCRAKTITPFYFGETINTDLANYSASEFNKTTTVGSFPPNSFGLHDLHGNVWEWCADYYNGNYQDAPKDGSVWQDEKNDEYRVLRGGSWDSFPQFCRCASRHWENPNVKDQEFGFRVVFVLDS